MKSKTLSWLPLRQFAYVVGLLAIGYLLHGQTVQAYTPDENGAYAWGAYWCGLQGSSYGAVGDYVWLEALDGSDTIVAYEGDTSVPINAFVGGQYCSGWPAGGQAWNDYNDLSGRIFGSFPVYPQTGANNRFVMGPRRTSINIDGLTSGRYLFKIELTTYTNLGVPIYASANSEIWLRLVIKKRWNINGQSYVRNVTQGSPNVNGGTVNAAPGDTIYWSHDMRNVGPQDMDEDVTYEVDKAGYTGSEAWLNGNKQPTGRARGDLGELFVKWYAPAGGGRLQKVITQDDVGAGDGNARICQRISWVRGAYNFDGRRASNDACVRVPYNFKMTPSVSAIAGAAEPGVTIGPITSSVTNAGPTKSYPNVRWELSRFVLKPGDAIPSTADNRTAPCSYYGGTCKTAVSGTNTFMPGDTPTGQIASDVVDDVALGSQLCYGLSLSGYEAGHRPGDGWWRHSTPRCMKVGKKPKVQIQGHDVAVRGTIDTSTTTKGSTTFGSWVEYGAFSTGANSLLASGAGLMNKSAGPSQSAWSKFTFANRGVPMSCGTQFGCYTTPTNFRPLPGIAAYFSAMQKTPYNTGASLDANAGETGKAITVRSADDLTLTGGQLKKGQTLVIVANNTVTITGDLTYAKGALTSVYDIPQLIIIARDINIHANVGTVDAWLVTSDLTNGTVNTCSDVTTPLTGSVCNTQLTVHGPVAAGKLLLRRTAGSGTGDASGDPAELFNLRPDTFLWARLVAGGAGKAETVSTVELPPRF